MKIIEEYINQTIKPEDIDMSHRLENPKKSKNANPNPLQWNTSYLILELRYIRIK